MRTVNRDQLEPVRLHPADAYRASWLAERVFRAHPFYQPLLGLGEKGFTAYWQFLLDMLFADPRSVALGIELRGKLVALSVTVPPGVPRPVAGVCFLRRLQRQAGWASLWRYLRFVVAYQHFMKTEHPAKVGVLHGLWLLVDPRLQGAGVGSELTRVVFDVLQERAPYLLVAMVDASDAALLGFYRRHGFTVHPARNLLGYQAAKIEKLVHRAGGGITS